MSLMDDLTKDLGKARLPHMRVGDTVEVHYLIKEGEKERVQIFKGVVLASQGRGVAKSIVVRRIVQGEGVERTFPLHSPRVRDVKVVRHGKVRQARLYYLRDRVGRQTRVAELVGEKARRHRRKASPDEIPAARKTEDDTAEDTEPAAVEV